MTDHWTAGLTGSRHIAATNLHAAFQARDPKPRAVALIDAHQVGLDRQQIAAILHDASPTLPGPQLAALGRYPRGHVPDRASFDLDDPVVITEDGPGRWPPYIDVLHELKTRMRPRGDLTAHEAIHIARTLAPPDDPVASVTCAVVLTGTTGQPTPLEQLRIDIALDIWDRS